jgi:hypothetical protein
LAASGRGVLVGRLAALVLVVLAGWLILGPVRQSAQADWRAIWIEPGRGSRPPDSYLGPPDESLEPGQVEAIVQRAQKLNF